MAIDALNWAPWKLDAESMKSILDGITVGMMERADIQDLVVAEADEEIHKPAQEMAILTWAACVHLHVTAWVTIQKEDPILKTAIEWISGWKVQDLKHLVWNNTNTEEVKTIPQEQKKLTLYQGVLYHCHTPTGKLQEVLQFIVPAAHQVEVATTNGCHQDVGHQDQQQKLYLLHDWFWWPGMAAQMQKAINSCEQCTQCEGTCAKALMWPIIVTALLELLHIDFINIETTMELDQPQNVVNVLVFCDHFMKHAERIDLDL